MNVTGISGSLRARSFNSALLRAACALAPEDMQVKIHSIADFPLYNGDDEKENGVPAAVENLKNEIARAHGLLIAAPEYNNSIPGVAKNAIDWLSRPPADIKRVFAGKPVAIMGATPGNFGTVLAQNAWLPVMRTLGTRLWTGGKMMLPNASVAFDDDGNLIDEAARERLKKFMNGFAAFIRTVKS